MTEQSNIYGEGSFTGGEQVSLPTPEKIEEKKKTYPLRIHFTGGSVDIMSPLPRYRLNRTTLNG